VKRRDKESLKDLLAIPRGEAQAWLVMALLLLGACGWIAYGHWRGPLTPVGLEAEVRVLDAWIAERDSLQRADSLGRQPQLFAFDPNGLPIEEWQRLGLSRKQAEAIHRYEEHGGSFRSKADLARMRVIKPQLFVKWEPYILLPDSAPSAYAAGGRREQGDRTAWKPDTLVERRDFSWERRSRPVVELNTSDTAMLVALPGIGPSFARGMIKYRDQLGGYRSLDQLGEVFVLQDKPEAVAQLKTLLVLDTLMVRRIPINTCTVEELAAHPYARWRIAKPLIAYRRQHGPFDEVAGIKACAVLTEDDFRKLAPYLTIE
jgi:competence protein ComEA